MRRTSRTWVVAMAIGVAGGFTGCDGEWDAFGRLSLRITDAPVDAAQHVFVQFSGLEIHGNNNRNVTLFYCEDPANASNRVISATACAKSKPMQIDLLEKNSGNSETLLSGYKLVSGDYQWIRLMVDTAGTEDTYLVLADGSEHELTIPSGDQTGLKLNRGFHVSSNEEVDFTIDFDLRKSVHETKNGYLLRPTLRIVDNSSAGGIAGTIASALVTTNCTPAVYVFAGATITPDDVDGADPDPVTTAPVKLNDQSGLYEYKAAFLDPGSYTAAFTCGAAADDPATSETLTFTGTADVTVAAKTVTTKNF